MSDQAPRDQPARLVEFPPLAARLRSNATALAVLTLVAIVVDGMWRGLSFGSMVRWLTVFAAALLLTTAIGVALHALRGAGTAQQRGERLSGDDVGLVPRRPRDP